jgi:hypothetical protein
MISSFLLLSKTKGCILQLSYKIVTLSKLDLVYNYDIKFFAATKNKTLHFAPF